MRFHQPEKLWIGEAIAGGAALVGGILGNQQNAANARAANEASLESTREQINFQREMSNTAYQRAMTDMRAAGLNPMLAFQQGGASSPAGASYKAEAPQYHDPVGPAVSSAVETRRLRNELELGAGNLGVAQGKLGLDTAGTKAEIALKAAQAAATTQSAKNAVTQQKILEAEAKKAKLDGDWYSSETGKEMYKLDRINNSIGGVLDSVNSAASAVTPLRRLKDLKGAIDPKGSKTPPAIPNPFNNKDKVNLNKYKDYVRP